MSNVSEEIKKVEGDIEQDIEKVEESFKKFLSHIGPQRLRKVRKAKKIVDASAEPAAEEETPGIIQEDTTVDVTGAKVIFHKDSNYDEYPYIYIRIAYPDTVAISTVQNTTITLTLESDDDDLTCDDLDFTQDGAKWSATGDFLNQSYLVTVNRQEYVIAAGIGENLTETEYSMKDNDQIPDTNMIKDVKVEGITATVERRIMQESFPGNVGWYGEPGSAASATFGWTYITYRVVADCTSVKGVNSSAVGVHYVYEGAGTDRVMDLSISHPLMEVGKKTNKIEYVMIVKLPETTPVPYGVNFEELDMIKSDIKDEALWTKVETYKGEIIRAFKEYAEAKGATNTYSTDTTGGGTLTLHIGTTVMEVIEEIIAYGKEKKIFTGETVIEDIGTYLESLDGLDTSILEPEGEGWEYVPEGYNLKCTVGTIGAADYAIGKDNRNIVWFFLTSAGEHKWE